MGTRCGLFEIKKIGDEYYSYITECKESKTATIVLRGTRLKLFDLVQVRYFLSVLVDCLECDGFGSSGFLNVQVPRRT